jgi:Flp pilus assembly protein TadD
MNAQKVDSYYPMKTFKATAQAIIILTVIFLSVIYTPFIVMLVTPRTDVSEVEKRKLAILPDLKWNIDSLCSFPAGFETYLKDHFGLRNKLISLHNTIKFNVLGKSPNPGVAIGKENWLFYKTDTFGISLVDDFRGLKTFTPSELEAIQIHFETKRDWLAEKGIQYLLVVVPNKQTVYPEYLPDYFNKVSDKTQLDQFVEYMNKNSDLNFLDLRADLLNAKKDHLIYFRTDSHWNDMGAYAAYKSMMNEIKNRFPEAGEPIAETEIKMTMSSHSGKDLAKLIGLPDMTENDIPSLSFKFPVIIPDKSPKWALKSWPWWVQPFETSDQSRKIRAVVFRDSFIDAMLPFFSKHFQQAAYIASKFDYSIMEYLIKEIKPDIVIEQGIERHLFLAFLPEAIYATMGNDLLIRGENEAAIEKFQKALEVKPDDPDSYCNLGFALLKTRRFDESIANFKHALTLDPNHAKANQNLRLVYNIIQKINIEITELENKLSSSPDDISLLNQLGRKYQQKGKTETALSYFSRVLKIDDADIDALNSIAGIYAQKKEYEKAISIFQKITALAPEKSEIYYNLACIYSIQNEIDKSISSLKTAIRKGYDNFGRIQSDNDLKNIRKNIHFKNLISTYHKKL